MEINLARYPRSRKVAGDGRGKSIRPGKYLMPAPSQARLNISNHPSGPQKPRFEKSIPPNDRINEIHPLKFTIFIGSRDDAASRLVTHSIRQNICDYKGMGQDCRQEQEFSNSKIPAPAG